MTQLAYSASNNLRESLSNLFHFLQSKWSIDNHGLLNPIDVHDVTRSKEPVAESYFRLNANCWTQSKVLWRHISPWD